MDHSATFGPTDSSAGAKTTVGSAIQISDKDITIHRLRVGKGNVVNAKECSGFITVEAVGLEGSHVYAYGNGSGGATNNGQNGPAEPIDCSIPISKNSVITISVTDAENAKNVVVGVEYHDGSGKNVRSYALGGAGQDTTATTPLALTTSPVMQKSGLIKEIRFAGSGVVDADAGSGELGIVVPGLPPASQEYCIGNGPGGATLGGPQWADVIDLPHGIPVTKGQTIGVNITTPEIMLSASCSFQVA